MVFLDQDWKRDGTSLGMAGEWDNELVIGLMT